MEHTYLKKKDPNLLFKMKVSFSFDIVPLGILSFNACIFGPNQKTLPIQKSRISPMFFSKTFTVSGLLFKSLIHFAFIFM